MRTIFSFIVVTMLLLLWSCNHNNREIESQPFNDSIKKYLDLASNDTIPFKTRDVYNQKAFSFIDLSKNDTLVRWYLNLNSFNFLSTRDWKDYLNSSKYHFQKSVSKKDTLNVARYYRYKASYYKNIDIVDSAYINYLKAERLYEKTNDLNGLGITIYNRGVLLYNINDYIEAGLIFNNSLNIFKRTNNKKHIALSQLSIANTLSDLGRIDESIEMYKLVINEFNKLNFKGISVIKANALNNLGDVYGRIGMYDEQMKYYQTALKDSKLEIEGPITYAILIINRSIALVKKNRFLNVEKDLLKILKNEENYNDSYTSFMTRIALSVYYQKKGEKNKAQMYSKMALLLARKSKRTYDILNGLKQVGFTNKDLAPKCLDEYDKKIDSLLLQERKKRSLFYKIQLETNEISQQKDKEVKQKWIISSVITGILIIVLLLFVVFRQKAKQKEMQLRQDQQKANEEIYQLLINQHVKEEEARQNEKKRIALELHDNVMNQLASTRFNLYAISQKTDKETIEKALIHIEKIKDIEKEIRNITHNLSNDVFTGTYSFKTILEKLIDEQNQTYQTHYKLELDTNIDWEVISGKLKMNLYRILQELIYNINKHAQATFAVISIVLDNNNICMAVQDNGKGFVVSESANGIGMKNIEQRLKEVQGKLNVRSSIGNGTSVFITIPV